MSDSEQGSNAITIEPIAPRRSSTDLGKRIVSGLVFAALALALLWWGLLPFAVMVGIVVVAMSWEWSRLVRGPSIAVDEASSATQRFLAGVDAALIVHALTVGGTTALAAMGFSALAIAILLAGTVIVTALTLGEHPLLSGLGVLYCGLPAIALLWLRASPELGFEAVVFVVLTVAITDTAAFASGRTIGGPKLAPRLSPNKTWSGLIGGIGTAALVAAAFAYALDFSPLTLGVSGLVMGLLAQAGDLGESALKRSFGVKDASNLIPGHGGFMDRMDGLVTASIAAAILALSIDPTAPARALLTGLT